MIILNIFYFSVFALLSKKVFFFIIILNFRLKNELPAFFFVFELLMLLLYLVNFIMISTP